MLGQWHAKKERKNVILSSAGLGNRIVRENSYRLFCGQIQTKKGLSWYKLQLVHNLCLITFETFQNLRDPQCALCIYSQTVPMCFSSFFLLAAMPRCTTVGAFGLECALQ